MEAGRGDISAVPGPDVVDAAGAVHLEARAGLHNDVIAAGADGDVVGDGLAAINLDLAVDGEVFELHIALGGDVAAERAAPAIGAGHGDVLEGDVFIDGAGEGNGAVCAGRLKGLAEIPVPLVADIGDGFVFAPPAVMPAIVPAAVPVVVLAEPAFDNPFGGVVGQLDIGDAVIVPGVHGLVIGPVVPVIPAAGRRLGFGGGLIRQGSHGHHSRYKAEGQEYRYKFFHFTNTSLLVVVPYMGRDVCVFVPTAPAVYAHLSPPPRGLGRGSGVMSVILHKQRPWVYFFF